MGSFKLLIRYLLFDTLSNFKMIAGLLLWKVMMKMAEKKREDKH